MTVILLQNTISPTGQWAKFRRSFLRRGDYANAIPSQQQIKSLPSRHFSSNMSHSYNSCQPSLFLPFLFTAAATTPFNSPLLAFLLSFSEDVASSHSFSISLSTGLGVRRNHSEKRDGWSMGSGIGVRLRLDLLLEGDFGLGGRWDSGIGVGLRSARELETCEKVIHLSGEAGGVG